MSAEGKKIKAVFCDLDGTLLNTIEDLADAMNRSLARFDLPAYTLDEHKMMVGRGVRAAVKKAFEGRGLEFREEHQRIFIDDYCENCVVKTKPYIGIPELMEELKNRGITVGVISNKAEELAWKICAQTLGVEQFAFFRGGREGVPLKPDPSSSLDEARKLGLKPSEIIFLGDSAVDMETAVNTGMFPCGVNWGFRSEEELKAGGSAKIIARPVDLLGLID